MPEASPDDRPDEAPVELPVERPALSPVLVPRRTPAPLILAAVLLGGVVVVSSVLAAVRGSSPSPVGPVRADVVTRFGPGTRARVEVLRDRAAIGLLALRRPEGDFTTRPGAGVDPAERREATAMGVLGLSIAKRMGSAVPGLSTAIAEARAVLFRAPKRGTIASANRSLNASALAATLLALSIGADPTDRVRVETATSALLAMTEPGPPIQGWPQAIVARAYADIIDTGRADYLGADPLAAIPIWDNLGETRDGADQRVSEALAQAIRFGRPRPGSSAEPSTIPAEIFAKVIADPIEWNGEQTDLARWTVRAWLAARVPGGDAWFARALPPLEQAVEADGRVEGEMYGYPTARSASILLILWEGMDLRGGGGG